MAGANLTRAAGGAVGHTLILGATSGIARGIAGALAHRGHGLILAGRDAAELTRLKSDCELRYGVACATIACDVRQPETGAQLVARAVALSDDGLAGVVVAVGLLGDQPRSQEDAGHAGEILDVNFGGVVKTLTPLVQYLESQGRGFLIVLSSVAGDRGRGSNYTYGAAKAGLSAWTQGVRARLFHAGVHVMTVKPGFVDTAMTYGLPGLFLVASPADAGERIVRALERRKHVIYVPWFWRWIMLIIRNIPEGLFKRLRL